MLVISMLVISFLTLVATFFAWRETSSRPSALNGVFASLTLLISARILLSGEAKPEMAVGLPLLAGMLLLGRGLGTWWRSKKEPNLKLPGMLWLGCGVATLSCVVGVYIKVTGS